MVQSRVLIPVVEKDPIMSTHIYRYINTSRLINRKNIIPLYSPPVNL